MHSALNWAKNWLFLHRYLILGHEKWHGRFLLGFLDHNLFGFGRGRSEHAPHRVHNRRSWNALPPFGLFRLLFDSHSHHALWVHLWPPFLQVLASVWCSWPREAWGVVSEEVSFVVKVLLQSCLSGVVDGRLVGAQGCPGIVLALLLTVSHGIGIHLLRVVLIRVMLLLYPVQWYAILGLNVPILNLLLNGKPKGHVVKLPAAVTEQLFELRHRILVVVGPKRMHAPLLAPAMPLLPLLQGVLVESWKLPLARERRGRLLERGGVLRRTLRLRPLILNGLNSVESWWDGLRARERGVSRAVGGLILEVVLVEVIVVVGLTRGGGTR